MIRRPPRSPLFPPAPHSRSPAGLLTYRLIVTDRGATDADQVQLRLTLPVCVVATAAPPAGSSTPERRPPDRDVVRTFHTLLPWMQSNRKGTHQVALVRISVP